MNRMPTVAILAGGLATRLGDIAHRTPKSLIEVAGRPFLHHQLDLLRASQITSVVVCAGHLGDVIKSAVPDGSNWGIDLTYSFDGPNPLGTGGAIKRALPLLGDVFFILYGDSYLPIDLRPLPPMLPPDREGLMTVFRNEGRWDTSNVLFENGVVQIYDKRHPVPEMRHIDYGISLMRASAFTGSTESAFDLSELLIQLVRRQRLAGCEVSQRFFEIGSPAGLGELRALLDPHSREEKD